MPIDISRENAFLNNYKGTYAPLVNLLILITTQYIYTAKCQKKKEITFVALAQKFYEMRMLEKIMAL